MGAYGEGGMVVTNDADYAHTIRMLRDWGAEKKYHHVLKGYNFRMEGIQGAVLRVKLRHLENWTEARRAVAARYDRLLAGRGSAYARGHDVRPTGLSRICDTQRPASPVAGSAERARHSHWDSLSDPRSSAAGVHKPGLHSRAVSPLRESGQRGVITPDVCRVDSGAVRSPR